jgi:type II secretory pathway pseudopilin PulG
VRKNGFTLIELLIYVSLFSVVGTALIYIFLTFVRIDFRQSAASEVASQANFILQKMQNLISNAGFVVVNDTENDEVDGLIAQGHSRLIIKARNEGNESSDGNSPIVIYEENGLIKVKQGRGSKQIVVVLNNNRVTVTNLRFSKVSNHPGRGVVLIDLSLQYNSSDPRQKVVNNFSLGVSKAAAAIFDTSLQPGANNMLDIGTGNNQWKDLFMSGNLSVSGTSVLGAGSDTVAYLKRGTLPIDPPSIAADSTATINMTLIGALSGDKIFLTPSYSLAAGLIFVGARTVTDGVDITIYNAGASTVNDVSSFWSYMLIR